MRLPHRGGARGRLEARQVRGTRRGKGGIAPGERSGLEFQSGPLEGTAEVILGLRVLPWKPGTAAGENGRDLGSGRATTQQFFGDPFIRNTPVGLREALGDAQPVQPMGVDVGGAVSGVGGSCWRSGKAGPPWEARVLALPALCRLQQSSAAGSQARASVEHFHPGRVTALVAPLGLLIGEAGQAAQMAPIGAGPVAAVELGQLFADAAGYGRWDGSGADLHPGLEMTGAGLENHAGLMPMGAHGGEDAGAGLIQIDEHVAGILLVGVGVEVDVTAFAVATAQESHGGSLGEQSSGPEAFSRGWSSSGLVNQTDEIEFVGHGRELSADGLQSQEESAIKHGGILLWEGIAVQ